MICTNGSCSAEATRIIAWPMLSGECMYVAPYCGQHAADVCKNEGGVPAAGPALSDEAAKIEGKR